MNLGLSEIIIICVIGLFFLLIPLIVALVIRSSAQKRSIGDSQQGRRVPCPFCAELILPEAKICRYCGKDLPGKFPG